MDEFQTFLNNTGHRLKKNGLQIGDLLHISPLFGKSKNLVLKRTKYEFEIGGREFLISNFINISLPTLEISKAYFRLYWRPSGLTGEGHYILESLGDTPFKLNGIYSFKAIIEKGDEFQLGHNIIKSQTQKIEGDLKDDQLPILSNMKLMQSELAILLTGETGTGKTSLAKKIHEKSCRQGRFVHLNLASFSEGLLESELFGHVKGAFTGATQDKSGAILEASHGTLFLDEIDSIPIPLQTKLLIFLDSLEFRAVGGTCLKKVETRLVFASGKNLEQLVLEGKMRMDFYFRISNSIHFYLKPIRADKSRLKNCINFYLSERGFSIDQGLCDFYLNQKWPGNFRQLCGHLDKKCIASENKLLKYDRLDELLLNTFSAMSEVHHETDESWPSLRDYQKSYVLRTYNFFDSNLEKSASILKISSKTVKTMLSEMREKTIQAS